MKDRQTIWLNGEFVTTNTPAISIYDSGLATGIGVFDTQLAINGKLTLGIDHFERLITDCKTVIRANPEYGIGELISISEELLERNNITKGRAKVRTTITGGIAKSPLAPATDKGLCLFMYVSPALDPAGIPPAKAWIKAWIIDKYPRIAGNPLENCKRLDYSGNYAARREAEKLGGNEAIITNTNGNIACTTTGNIFIKEGRKTITPPLAEGIINGITRKKLLEQGKATEEIITPQRLLAADSAFLTNSIIGIREILEVNGKPFTTTSSNI